MSVLRDAILVLLWFQNFHLWSVLAGFMAKTVLSLVPNGPSLRLKQSGSSLQKSTQIFDKNQCSELTTTPY